MVDVTLIFPAYNDAKCIVETVKKAVEYFVRQNISYEIIVSADGDDGTCELVMELGRRKRIRQAVNMATGK